MTVLYSWDSSAPGIDGGGVSGTEESAKAAVVAWMRLHGAYRALVERVCLSTTTRLVPGYLPTGYALAAERRGNHRIVWTRVCTRETELAAS